MLTHFSRLIRYEFRRFRGRSRLALLFILIIPLMYGGIYLHANWDLYAHIDDVKVAVVNHDRPAEFGGKRVAGGEQFVSALKERPVFDWQFLGEDDTAATDGLRKGDYFMVITVPENFSSNLVSAGDYKPARAMLKLHRDDANGFIIGTLTGKAEDALGKTLDTTVSQTYFEALLVNVDKSRVGLGKAAEGAKKLDVNLAKAASGVHQVDTAVTSAVSKNQAVNASVEKAAAGIASAERGADKVAAGASTIGRGAATLTATGRQAVGDVRRVNQAALPLLDFARRDIPEMVKNARDLVRVSASLTGPKGGSVVSIERNISGAGESVRALVRNHPELARDPDYIALVRQLNGAASSTTTVRSNLGVVAELSGGLNLTLNSAHLDAAGKAVQNAVRDADATAGGLDKGLAQIQTGLGQADGGVADLRAGARSLGEAGRGMISKATEALSGIVQLSNALGRLDTAMPQLSAGAHELSSGLADGVKQIPQLSDDQRQDLSSVMASPVDIEQVVDHDARYYGRGLAPMFFSIALWIACVSSFLVVRTVSGRALTGRAGPWRISLFGFGPLAVIGVAGALLMGGGVWLLLGLDPVHPWLFWLLLVVASLSFMALAHWVRLILGSPQTAVYLVLLILQLPACGGVFPVAMLNAFYQGLAVVAPMRYSVDAFRVAISGGQMSTYWGSLAVLMGILVASLGIIVVLIKRRQRFRMRDLHPPMVTSSSTADYAFSIRPR